jgi:hypothetical protein
MIIVYVVSKFCVYCVICSLLAHSFNLELVSRWNFSIVWGAARFGLGLLFGVPIALLYFAFLSADLNSVLSYIVAFVPMRYVEWALLFALIAHKHSIPWSSKAHQWILSGAAASMLLDGIAILAGAKEIKFFC